MKSPLITIGIVFGKNDLKYLSYTLKSVFEQTYRDFEVILHNNVLDEDDVVEDDKVWKWVEENYPQVKLERSGNVGFGAAHNEMMQQMKGDYYLCCNPDILLEKDFLEKLVGFLNEKKDEKIGVLGGELRYWDFEKKDTESLGKTEVIDSLGLKVFKTHQVVDWKQGEKSKSSPLLGEIERGKKGDANTPPNLPYKGRDIEVFGVSGALFLVSKECLEAVGYEKSSSLLGEIERGKKGDANTSPNLPYKGREKTKEYFDEMIFLYKEDVDLAYRVRLAGYKAFVVCDALAYHDRSVPASGRFWQNRKSKKRLIKGRTLNTWSFYHHHLLLYKNWQKWFGWKVKLATLGYEVVSNLYVLVFEFGTFWNGWRLFWRNFSEIKKRKEMTVKEVGAGEIEKFMK